jgi:hypothetical protein
MLPIKKIEVLTIGEQEGQSYDSDLIQKEREEILGKIYKPIQRASLDRYSAMVDHPMRPYYEYLSHYPWLEKMVRRIVRIHKKIKKVH